MSQTGQAVRFPRAEHGGLLLGLTLPQLILTGVALPLIAVAAFAGFGPAPALLLALSGGTLLATAFGRVDAHPAYRWLLLRGTTQVRRARTGSALAPNARERRERWDFRVRRRACAWCSGTRSLGRVSPPCMIPMRAP